MRKRVVARGSRTAAPGSRNKTVHSPDQMDAYALRVDVARHIADATKQHRERHDEQTSHGHGNCANRQGTKPRRPAVRLAHGGHRCGSHAIARQSLIAAPLHLRVTLEPVALAVAPVADSR